MTIERVDRLISANKAGFGIVITDVNGRIQHVNPEVTAMTGYTREEAVGQSPRIFKSGRQTPALYEELWNTIRSGRVWRGDVINRRKDGTFYQEDLQIAPVHDSKREVVSYIAIKREVTKPRGAEEGHAFLAAIGENSEDAIVAYTAAGVILTWNRGAELISNYSAGDAIGKHVSMLVPPDRLAELSIFTERILQGSAATQPDGMCVGKPERCWPRS